MHLVYPPKFCITIVSNFSWVTQSSQEKLKTTVKHFFLGGRGGEGGWKRGVAGVNKVHYGLCGNSDILQMEMRLKLTLFSYSPSM